MKKLYTLLSFFLLVKIGSANTVITAVNNNGKWKNNSTWDLNRKPQNGDTVVIPIGMTVKIDNNINLSSATVYVKVGGTLELDGGKLKINDNSVVLVYNGASIIAHGSNSEQIQIGSTIKYKGSHGMIAGPAIADASTGTSPNGFKPTGLGALPVHFSGFNVAVQNKNVLVEWATASESNSAYFEIQRSENGSDWNTIATVHAAGNSSEVKTYSYTDYSVSTAIVYYRVKEVDIDGRFIMTAIRSAKMQLENSAGATEIKISSGGNSNVYLHFSSTVQGNVSIKLVSLSGQVIYNTTVSNPVGQKIINVNSNIKGVYVVAVSNGLGVQQAGKIIL
ncbi:MAG TPA: G8 domain-containing protein [Chitinophagaceae bacterium]|nr:T9SS type A sorting domain-containing protein [Chitinophagaceae bacterium]MCB9054577.1 T9SS type A sorting domain-containing protein [Chitinophagales bacterium]HPG11839.1 G8 domain-containing protein [Chitinophagaceae bacterium]